MAAPSDPPPRVHRGPPRPAAPPPSPAAHADAAVAWKGQSGRTYRAKDGEPPRRGGMATVRAVVAEGPPVGTSTVPPDVLLALKIARTDLPEATAALDQEVALMVELCDNLRPPPCPRVVDRIGGQPALGVVIEWCPFDLEGWWVDRHAAPDAFRELCEAMSAVCRRIAEYQGYRREALNEVATHADVKPRNVLRSREGRWLLTDFGAARSRPDDKKNWNATEVIVGTENFMAPEVLFNARKRHPHAIDTWSVAATFLSLLRLGSILEAGQPRPAGGTQCLALRSHRQGLVFDLYQRKPEAFVDKELDARYFPNPDRLPDADRATVAAALAGVFGTRDEALDSQLVLQATRFLDRALAIDPGKRYLEPREMASDFDLLARRYTEIRAQVRGAQPVADEGDATRIIAPEGPKAPKAVRSEVVRELTESLSRHEARLAAMQEAIARATEKLAAIDARLAASEKLAAATESEARDARAEGKRAAREAADATEAAREATETARKATEAAHSANEAARTRPESPRADPEPPRVRTRAPMWLVAAVLVLFVGQVVTWLGMGGLAWLGLGESGDGAAVADAPEDPVVAEPPPPEEAEEEVVEEEEDAEPAEEAAVEDAGPAPAATPEAPVASPSPPPAPATSSQSTPTGTASASSSLSKPSSKPAAATRIEKTEPAPPLPPAGDATVRVEGAKAYFQGATGRFNPGTVPAGSYQLFAQVTPNSQAYTAVGAVTLSGGEDLTYKCAFGGCKRVK